MFDHIEQQIVDAIRRCFPDMARQHNYGDALNPWTIAIKAIFYMTGYRNNFLSCSNSVDRTPLYTSAQIWNHVQEALKLELPVSRVFNQTGEGRYSTTWHDNEDKSVLAAQVAWGPANEVVQAFKNLLHADSKYRVFIFEKPHRKVPGTNERIDAYCKQLIQESRNTQKDARYLLCKWVNERDQFFFDLYVA